jgi:O-antigen ligase
MNYSVLAKKTPWIVIGSFTVLTGAMAIVNMRWNYLGMLLFLPLFIYFFFKKNIFFFGFYAFLLSLDTVFTSQSVGAVASITKYAATLAMIVFCAKCLVEEKLQRPHKTVIWWILLSLYSLLTLTWASVPQPSYIIINIISIPAFYLVVSSYKVNRKDYEMLKWFIIAGGVAATLLIMLGYDILLQSGKQFNRVSVIIGDDEITYQNFIAFALLLPTSMSLEKILQQGARSKKIFFTVILGLLLMGIVLSGSRGGMLGAGVIFLVYFLLSTKKITFLTLVVPLGILVISLSPNFLFERWEIAAKTGGAGRLTIWQVGLKALGKYWITGAGMGNFPAAYTEFVNYGSRYVGIYRGSHNLYLGMFVELGIIGFALMIIGFAAHYKAIDKVVSFNRSDFDAIMLKASFWSLLVSSFFLDTFWYKQLWILWMLIMIRKNALEG